MSACGWHAVKDQNHRKSHAFSAAKYAHSRRSDVAQDRTGGNAVSNGRPMAFVMPEVAQTFGAQSKIDERRG